MDKSIKEKILNYITQNFSVNREDVFLDESLIDQGIIDSTGLLEIVSFIEEEYSFTIEEEQLIIENFGSLIKIVNFVQHMIGEKNKISYQA